MNSYCLIALSVALAACGFVIAQRADIFGNKAGYDGQRDLWYLEDNNVNQQTAATRYNNLKISPFSKETYPELHNEFVLAQQTSKKMGQTFDDRWDVRVWDQYQFFALYDGINQPSVVNRLRSILLREVGNAVSDDLKKLDQAFVAAKDGGEDLMTAYLNLKMEVFKKISNTITQVEQYNSNANNKSAATAAIVIVSPNFVLVAQVGAVHVLSYKYLTPISLTTDQTRNGPDVANFGLDQCTNYMEQELCMSTRVFGAPSGKETRPGQRPTHISQPFIKLYKRVEAPFLNDNDYILGANSFSGAPSFISNPNPGDSVDTANLPVVETDLGIPETDVEAIANAKKDHNELKYLLITTHPIRRNLDPNEIARIVAQNMHDSFKRNAGTVKSIMTLTLRQIVESAQSKQSSQGWNSFVNSFFSDITALYVPLVTDPSRYHF